MKATAQRKQTEQCRPKCNTRGNKEIGIAKEARGSRDGLHFNVTRILVVYDQCMRMQHLRACSRRRAGFLAHACTPTAAKSAHCLTSLRISCAVLTSKPGRTPYAFPNRASGAMLFANQEDTPVTTPPPGYGTGSHRGVVAP